jgi:alkanesulfonate monooxygenase SsuD/methylene tetrahydromethanopterin reductase-like flavin-dependent oxidoreductase (luciferase family)
VILPQRHPIQLAKEVATLDVLSGGRAIGVGIGWLREECEAIGVPFEDRAARAHESVRAMRSLWREEAEPFDLTFFRWPAVESNPKPVQKPGVPIVVARSTEIAAKRAARYGDGFFPPIGDPDRLESLLAVMRAECEKRGRRVEDIEITVGDAFAPGVPDIPTIERLAELGAPRYMMVPWATDIDGIRRGLSDFAEDVIAKL